MDVHKFDILVGRTNTEQEDKPKLIPERKTLKRADVTIFRDMVTSTTSHKHKTWSRNKQEVGAHGVRGDSKEGLTVDQKRPALSSSHLESKQMDEEKGSGDDSQNF